MIPFAIQQYKAQGFGRDIDRGRHEMRRPPISSSLRKIPGLRIASSAIWNSQGLTYSR